MMSGKLGSCLYQFTLYLLLCDIGFCKHCECTSSNDDKWNPWGTFSPCDNANPCVKGNQTRKRTFRDIFCPECNDECTLFPNGCERRTCGKEKNGCEQICGVDGSCSCNQGYFLDNVSGKFCHDKNECEVNNGSCSQKCVNSIGSYDCRCHDGYYLDADGKTCIPYPCQTLLLNKCPVDTYIDHMGPVCNNVTVVCPNGNRFGDKCNFECPAGFGLATVNRMVNKKFGEDLQSADFNNIKSEISCIYNAGVKWNIHSSVYQNYYCRRLQDPPKYLSLSNNTILEHTASHTNIGSISVYHPSPVVYSIEQSEGMNSFVVHLHFLQNSQVLTLKYLSDTSIDVMIRATDTKNSALYTESLFTINVVNVNDPPQDIQISGSTITDLSPVGTVIGKLSAIDYDTVQPKRSSDIFVWTLTDPSNEYFSIQNGSYLVLKKRVSHKIDFIHKVSITCTDKDSIPASSAKDVFIESKNLNSPPLNITIVLHPVLEDKKQGSVIGEITANDNDNDTIKFELLSNNQLLNFSIPTCVHIGGSKVQCRSSIVLLQELDFEKKIEYDLNVKAVDEKEEFELKNFLLKVVDVNESPYDVNIRLNEINEDSQKDTLAGELEVLDVDADSAHTCLIINSETLFKLRGFNIVLKDDQKLDYAKQSVYNVTVTCSDNGSPPLSITKTVPIYLTASFNCSEKSTRVPNFKCVCRNKLFGPDCDRNESLCSIPCPEDDACSTFVSSPRRCIPTTNQLPVLLKLSFDEYKMGMTKYDLEKEMKTFLENRNKLTTRKRRRKATDETIYIEGSGALAVETSYTYVKFLPMDEQSSFKLLQRDVLCPRIKDTTMRCVNAEDCKILEAAGISCPLSFGLEVITPDKQKEDEKGSDDGTPFWVYVVAAVVFLGLVVIMLLLLYKRHSKTGKKNLENVTYNSTSNNLNYSPVTREGSPVKNNKPLNNEPVNIISGNQTMRDINALRRKTDITVFDNAIFSPNHVPAAGTFEFHNAAYGIQSATNHSYIDDKNNVGSPVSEGNSHIYASIGKSGLNPLYEKSFKEEYSHVALPAEDVKVEKVKMVDEEMNGTNNDEVSRPNSAYCEEVDLSEEKCKAKSIEEEEKKVEEPRYERPIIRGPSVNQFRPDVDEQDKMFKKTKLKDDSTDC